MGKIKTEMNECYGKKFILNGMVQPSGLFENSMVYEGDSIYEVIRMVKGVPVFFSDHMERLFSSVRLQGKEQLADRDVIRKDVINLTKTDKKKGINLKIVFNYNRGSSNYLIYFIEPIYPSGEQYRHGVKGVLFYGERNNPESKVINHKLRSSIFHKLIMYGAYEALLVNRDDCITEGSRSNIFFLKGKKLVTAPDEKILSGITRKYILDICRERGITVEFRCVPVAEIPEYDAVFMTGTSPMVLQFYCIENQNFKVRVQLVELLRKLYLEKADESVRRFITND